MVTQTEYLIKEFEKYFPEAEKIEVFYMGEIIEVLVDDSPWQFEAGSDDDWYQFINEDGVIITVPLMEADDDND